ncbi:MAG: hydroxysqualene dehydroxylase HpnE [Phycisphaerales bacterium]|nr:hydroxysqualene dehydroxylase HpnE [Phycisphaerales bacterium]
MSSRPVIIGAGLAGLTAALRLADADLRPLVLETRKGPGGRAISFDDVRSDLVLDNCQHVLMGCCTNLIALLEQIGVADAIEWSDTLAWMRPDGGVDVLETGRLPAPAHRMGSLLRMRLFSLREKVKLGRTMVKILRLGRSGHELWRGRTFAAFLDTCPCTEQLRQLFWDPVIISACNLALHEVAATHAFHVIQDAFLASREAGRIGVPSKPLSALYEPAVAKLTAAGGELRTGASVSRIEVGERRVKAVHTRSEVIPCDDVICSVPFNRLGSMLDAPDARVEGLRHLEHSPILGVHLLVDRVLMQREHLVTAGRQVQWVFNKGPLPEGAGQHLHAVISGADDWMALDEASIRHRILEDLEGVFPALRVAKIVGFRPVKERQATFRATPEAEALRPEAAPGQSDVQGLYLAGDWCRTGWPATMEGAVISGHLAAQALLGEAAAGPKGPLAPARLPRWLGIRR